MTQPELLDYLETEIRHLLEQLRSEISPLSDESLTYRPTQEQWTILECCAHLNIFAERYIQRIESAIHKAKARKWGKGASGVRYTFIAKWDINRANPKNGKKLRAKKGYDFYGEKLDRSALKITIIHLERLLRNVLAAREVDINRPKVGRGKSGFFSYTLGNTLEWLTLHNRRHAEQMLALKNTRL